MPHERQIGSLITRAETQRLVADLYNQGMPIKEIAAQVPVCLATVYRCEFSHARERCSHRCEQLAYNHFLIVGL